MNYLDLVLHRSHNFWKPEGVVNQTYMNAEEIILKRSHYGRREVLRESIPHLFHILSKYDIF